MTTFDLNKDSVADTDTEYTAVKCPYCGHSYYRVLTQVATCMAWQRVFKDGKEISKDPNAYTSYCECFECGKEFNVIRQEGKLTVVGAEK